MVQNNRGVGTLLACGLLVGCLSGKKSPPRLPHETEEDTRGELSQEECASTAPEGAPPFDVGAADGALKHAIENAWSCGLHTLSHFDLSIQMSWGNRGCVAQVALEMRSRAVSASASSGVSATPRFGPSAAARRRFGFA